MNIKGMFKNKKLKNILVTIIEILVVSGIIFGILMFFHGKVSKEADKAGGLNGKGLEAETKAEDVSGSDDYYIEVNKKLSAVIVYQYSEDKKTKTAYKVFRCSVGSSLKKGKYKTSNTYSWIDINGKWHKYNTQFSAKAWIQSVGYNDKYSYTLNKNSYKAIGKTQKCGSCILLTAGDANWIYENCKTGTVVSVINGKKGDVLPISPEDTIKSQKYCGWDPTDPDKNNPYKKIKNGTIVSGLTTVYVEKGQEAEYLGNLLALDENGKNITGSLKYSKIDIDTLGSQKATFKYKLSSGKTVKLTQKFKVVDTTPPKVYCSASLFTYEVASKDKNDMNKESNITDITNMVKASASSNESGVKITVYTVGKDELEEGKFPVVVKAQDSSGNVGSCQVMVEIKVKKENPNTKYRPSKDVEAKRKKKAGLEEATTKKEKNKKKEPATKNNSEKSTEKSTQESITDK